MAYRTFVARAADGFPLVEAQGEAGLSPGAGLAQTACKQAQRLLMNLHSMPPRSSVDCAAGYACHLQIADGVCYLGLFCDRYPPNAAFAFLEDIMAAFQEELKREFGTGSVDYRSHIDCVAKPYHFSRFDRQVARIYAQFKDPSSSAVLCKLQACPQVSYIMRCSFDQAVGGGKVEESPKRVFEKVGASSTKGTMTKCGVFCLATMVMALLVYLVVEFAPRELQSEWPTKENLQRTVDDLKAKSGGAAVLCYCVAGFVALAAIVWAILTLSGRRRALAASKAASQLLAFAGEYGEHLHLL